MNVKKDDGYMPGLHLAALNDHLDVVTALAEMVIVKCIRYHNIVAMFCGKLLPCN